MRRRTALLAATLALVAAACGGGGDSILESGLETDTTPPPPTTQPATDDGAATTATDATDGADGAPPATTAPAPTAPPSTISTPLDQFPPCPVDALEGADGPVDVLMWHGLTGATEDGINFLADQYNASQSRVRVQLEPQGSYDTTIDKYVQSGQDSRPDLVLFPEYVVQQTIDSESVIPIEACIDAAGFDVGTFQPATIKAYSTAGVQWAMPFNVSNPVLYYNRSMFREAGLDPDDPPQSLEELRAYSQAIVDSGAAAYGIAIDSATDSGGGWFIEQWFANAGELYADNDNGRAAPATRVLYDSPAGVELLTFVQQLVQDGLAFYVGGNASGQDNFLKLADADEPAAMTIGTSAALGTIIDVIDGGLIPDITGDDIGIGPLPGPAGTPTALVGGAALYVVADHGDETAAAAWDFITYLVSPAAQSEWAVQTGYVPVRTDALDVEPVATTYVDDPRFRVAYDQLIGSPDEPALQGPILGPQRDVRVVTARAVAEILDGGDVQAALSNAASQANALITEYNARN
ncbi:MAG: ABC transporter substrate-binding protein [Ilumatobacter sp.]|uniref:ABC transporter substrate-binding protein n=1 Tax=Ilumatobacter sp. TaxID=1967498 RepID=UPI00261A3089|nr:ABC transporter substrate-binding protein [Ilumatobacter sp.]MDJ0768540.1 ABC transporter substrate-binding protein [Ilumatobacter sp.]